MLPRGSRGCANHSQRPGNSLAHPVGIDAHNHGQVRDPGDAGRQSRRWRNNRACGSVNSWLGLRQKGQSASCLGIVRCGDSLWRRFDNPGDFRAQRNRRPQDGECRVNPLCDSDGLRYPGHVVCDSEARNRTRRCDLRSVHVCLVRRSRGFGDQPAYSRTTSIHRDKPRLCGPFLSRLWFSFAFWAPCSWW